MASTDERLTALEQAAQSQGQDIRLLFDQLSEIRAEIAERFHHMDMRLDTITEQLVHILQKLDERT
jgi:uncharacterized coiled-coil protein SlyX